MISEAVRSRTIGAPHAHSVVHNVVIIIISDLGPQSDNRLQSDLSPYVA